MGLTLGLIYGADLGSKLLAFILSAAAVGVTFNAVDEAKKMYDKWQLDSNNWEPPIEPGDPHNKGWKDIIKNTLTGGLLIGSGLIAVNNIKDWFQSLGVKEGENIYSSSDGIKYINNIPYSTRVYTNPGNLNFIWVEIFGIGDSRIQSHNSSLTGDDAIDGVITVTDALLANSGGYASINFTYDITWNTIKGTTVYNWELTNQTLGTQLRVDGSRLLYNNAVEYLNNLEPVLPENDTIVYNVSNDSYVITNNLPSKLPSIPLPLIESLPNVNPLIKPNGNEVLSYVGTADDLIKDIVDNIPANDLLEYSSISEGFYTIVEVDNETGTLIEIDIGEVGLPFPDTINPEIPEDELQGQGIIITFLKSIINWLFNIFLLPEKLINKYFIPKPNYLDLKINNLQLKVNGKLNLPDLTPLPSVFQGITCSPIPDGYIGNNKVLDASYINDLAPTIVLWQRFFWWLVIILIGANNAYKLIRGTDLITIYGKGGKGN